MNAPKTRFTGFFTDNISESDPEIFAAMQSELGRQRDEIELIASERFGHPRYWAPYLLIGNWQ